MLTKKKAKTQSFQVLLLHNDDSDNVEVQEAQDVDFLQVKEHLQNGGSVFITSKASQKLFHPAFNAQRNYSRSRRTMGFLFRQHLRSS